MAAFDAGSIESQLTLDRSPFSEGLRIARQQGEEFERQRWTAQADVDTGDALTALGEVTGAADHLDGRQIDITVDVDAANALAELEVVDAEADRLDGRDVTVNTHTNARDTDSALAKLGQRIPWLLAVALPAFGMVSAAAAPALGLVAGLGSATVAAMGAAAPAVLAMVGLWKQYAEAQKAVDTAQKKVDSAKTVKDRTAATKELAAAQRELNQQFGPMARGATALDHAISGLQRATRGQAMRLFAQGLQLAAMVLPRFTPLARAALGVFSQFMGGLQRFARSRDFTAMIGFFQRIGIPALRDFGFTIGNLILGVGRLAGAFGPLALRITHGLLGMSRGFADWAKNLSGTAGFQHFIDFITSNGPKLLSVLGDVAQTLLRLGQASAGMGLGLFSTIGLIARMINMIPMSTLKILVPVIASLIISFKIFSGVMSVVNAVLSANPWVLLAVAIIALGVALVVLYKHSATFRAIVQGALHGVETAGRAVANFFAHTFPQAFIIAFRWVEHAAGVVGRAFIATWHAVVSGTTTAWRAVSSAVMTGVRFVVRVVEAGIRPILAFWRGFWSEFGPLIRAVFNLVVAIVQLHLRIIRFAISTVLWAIRGAWHAGWAAISAITRVAMGAIRAVVGALVRWLGPVVRGGMAVVRAVFSAGWSAARAVTSVAMGVIRGVVSAGIATVKAVVRTIMVIVGFFRSAWNQATGAVRAAVSVMLGIAGSIGSRIIGAVGSLGSLLYNAGKDVIQGLINGITSMIGNVTGILHHITGLIPLHKGPPSKDRKLLYKTGQSIIQGLVNGMWGTVPQLQSQLHAITRFLVKIGASRELRDAVLRDNHELLMLARQRQYVITQLVAAQKHLADLRKSQRELVSSVTQSIVDANGVDALTQSGATTPTAFLQAFRARVAQAQQFSANIRRLIRMGLNRTAVQQFVDQGVDTAGGTVDMLAHAGRATIKQMNELQEQLYRTAHAAGLKVGHQMYDAGIQAALGLIRGLKKHEHALERQMQHLANIIVRAIRRALRAHSPAQALVEVGEDGGDGILVGFANKKKAIEQLLAELINVQRLTPANAAGINGGYATSPQQHPAEPRWPRTMIVRIGDHEFVGYVDGIVDDHDNRNAKRIRHGKAR